MIILINITYITTVILKTGTTTTSTTITTTNTKNRNDNTTCSTKFFFGFLAPKIRVYSTTVLPRGYKKPLIPPWYYIHVVVVQIILSIKFKMSIVGLLKIKQIYN